MNAISALKKAMKYAESLSYGEVKPSQDYDDLKNAPITNLEGSLSSPILLSELSSGVYRITGNYYVCDTNDTCYIDPGGVNLFFVSDEAKSILKITSNSMVFFNISDNSYSENSIPSFEAITALLNDVRKTIPTKVSDLENDSGFITADEVSESVKNYIDENFDAINSGEISDLF